eukprot:TRINITY_DN8261_c0_g2_i1.p2 TRINITY_DN8261_c0_g2~~TRINITY_DN8261_c0_g2_i1.p2  ORF type:complete len:149 (+),score=48.06 TRINITY_DN8261_c0_g2_i1:105-551(+)
MGNQSSRLVNAAVSVATKPKNWVLPESPPAEPQVRDEPTPAPATEEEPGTPAPLRSCIRSGTRVAAPSRKVSFCLELDTVDISSADRKQFEDRYTGPIRLQEAPYRKRRHLRRTEAQLARMDAALHALQARILSWGSAEAWGDWFATC